MRAARIAVLVSLSVGFAMRADAATKRRVVGQAVFVKKGESLHRTFLFGLLHENRGLKVIEWGMHEGTYGRWIQLPKKGTYRLTNDVAGGRRGLRGKGWIGDEIVVTKLGDELIL
jgi:hypothetical protein